MLRPAEKGRAFTSSESGTLGGYKSIINTTESMRKLYRIGAAREQRPDWPKEGGEDASQASSHQAQVRNYLSIFFSFVICAVMLRIQLDAKLLNEDEAVCRQKLTGLAIATKRVGGIPQSGKQQLGLKGIF